MHSNRKERLTVRHSWLAQGATKANRAQAEINEYPAKFDEISPWVRQVRADVTDDHVWAEFGERSPLTVSGNLISCVIRMEITYNEHKFIESRALQHQTEEPGVAETTVRKARLGPTPQSSSADRSGRLGPAAGESDGGVDASATERRHSRG